jgi:hypothetical protein
MSAYDCQLRLLSASSDHVCSALLGTIRNSKSAYEGRSKAFILSPACPGALSVFPHLLFMDFLLARSESKFELGLCVESIVLSFNIMMAYDGDGRTVGVWQRKTHTLFS